MSLALGIIKGFRYYSHAAADCPRLMFISSIPLGRKKQGYICATIQLLRLKHDTIPRQGYGYPSWYFNSSAMEPSVMAHAVTSWGKIPPGDEKTCSDHADCAYISSHAKRRSTAVTIPPLEMRSLVASVALTVLPAVLAAVPSLKLTVTGPLNVTDVDNLFVKTVVTNTGSDSVKLLKNPSSVLSDWQTNSFSIESSLGTPLFTGIRIKYSPELALKSGDASNFMTIAAGESFELTHSLAGVYNFTRSGAGEYSFSASNFFQYVDETGQLANVRAETATNKLRLGGSLVSLRHKQNFKRRGITRRDIGYSGCSSDQQSSISAAANSANEYVASAITYLDGISTGTDRYTQWFGTFDSTRLSTVKSHFTNIGTDATSSTYDCSCTESATYAYVYQDSPGYVYLCNAFWSATETGTDSRAGTLVHEQSHFVVNGGTDDHVYGSVSAHSLAASDPDQAIDNADNHEYFVENNPILT